MDYKQPRRLNVVSVTLLLGAAAAGYWFWRFFPAYFAAWTVDHILKEGATAVYQVSRISEPARSEQLKIIVDKARDQIIKHAGVTDPELLVNLDLEDEKAIMSADYLVVVTHPYLTRTTTLRFHRSRQSDIKQVKWE